MSAVAAIGERAAGRRHRRIALLATVCAVLFAGPASHLEPHVQAILLGVGVLLTGVPHGAVDHHRMAPILRGRLGPIWLPTFLLGYVALALAVAIVWWLLPTASLVVFLVMSVHHFGTGDAKDPLGVLVHGSLPILMPAIAHPEAVGELFSLLTTGDAAVWNDILRQARPALLLATSLMLAAFVFRPRRAAGELVEVLAVAVAGLLLPPLLSFGLYFCIWHAPRHILVVAQELRPGPWPRALGGFGWSALPMTVATIAAGALIWVMLPTDQVPLRRWLQMVFIGLASLTVPHLIVTDALRRSLRAQPGSM
ncbi:MAG: Brp/Blh family beta-carotene 15,15'-monooxygenase [Neolewinella sp.]|jgi:Brp/Blh family beta-carotene 15,15'-monooxygenase